jgi:hypothetical protein
MIIVLVPIHGLQRFWLGQVGMGSATCSLSRFSVGWQYLRSRRLEGLGFNYYQKVASQIVANIQGLDASSPSPIDRAFIQHA